MVSRSRPSPGVMSPRRSIALIVLRLAPRGRISSLSFSRRRTGLQPSESVSSWYPSWMCESRSCSVSVSFCPRSAAFFFTIYHAHSPEGQLSVSPNRRTGRSVRQDTPYRCKILNDGLCESISSCLRLSAKMSPALSGLISGASNISCSYSISSMMCSTSMPSQYLTKRRERSITVPSPSVEFVPTQDRLLS